MPCSKSKDITNMTSIPFVRIDETDLKKSKIDDGSKKNIATNISQGLICSDSRENHQSLNQNMTEIATNATTSYLCTDSRTLFPKEIHLSSKTSATLNTKINSG